MEALFSIGQKVVCVDSTPAKGSGSNPLIEGKSYPVKGIYGCTCGRVLIDVGIKFSEIHTTKCVKCLTQINIGTEWIFNQHRFVPIDDDRAMDEQIRESLNQHLIEK